MSPRLDSENAFYSSRSSLDSKRGSKASQSHNEWFFSFHAGYSEILEEKDRS
jgi:hypothetical protein